MERTLLDDKMGASPLGKPIGVYWSDEDHFNQTPVMVAYVWEQGVTHLKFPGNGALVIISVTPGLLKYLCAQLPTWSRAQGLTLLTAEVSSGEIHPFLDAGFKGQVPYVFGDVSDPVNPIQSYGNLAFTPPPMTKLISGGSIEMPYSPSETPDYGLPVTEKLQILINHYQRLERDRMNAYAASEFSSPSLGQPIVDTIALDDALEKCAAEIEALKKQLPSPPN